MRKSLSLLTAAVAAMALATAAHAETLKVGMITTLSGGGAALGIDVRDGFMLAIKQAGADIEVVVDDDQRKPDIAVQLADKLIQSDKVDVLTGIIWSNLAIAVVPAAVQQGQVLPLAQRGAVASRRQTLSQELLQRRLAERHLAEAAGSYANDAGYTNSFILAPNYPAAETCSPATSAFIRATSPTRSTPSWARTSTRRRSRRFGPQAPTACTSSCRAAWASPSSSSMPNPASTFAYRPGLLLRSGDSASGRRGGAGCEEHLAMVQGHRQFRPTRPSSRASRPNTAACPHSMRARASTRRTC